MRFKTYGYKNGPLRVIHAWIGYSDGKPYVFRNDHNQDEWCVFTTRADARKAFADVRRVSLLITEGKAGD